MNKFTVGLGAGLMISVLIFAILLLLAQIANPTALVYVWIAVEVILVIIGAILFLNGVKQ